MAYCIYLRKSRADRELMLATDEDVLSRHERTLTELAQRCNYKITKIFREVVSGETLAARPQMQQLLSEIENGLWEGVLVMEVERLARGNSIDQGIVSQAFKFSNTLIITPAKIYNPANEFDEEYFEFGLFMSRREYKTINRRLNAGRLASCREGKYVGSIPPYGYQRKKLEKQKGWILVPDPVEADAVKLIFKLYTQQNRIGARLISKKLDALGIKPRKNDKWSLVTIRGILTNEVYIGKIVWNREKTVKSTVNGVIVKSRPVQEHYDVFDGLHEPLVDEETFNKAQYYMSLNPRNPVSRNKTFKNPLAGIMICAFCGKKIIRRPSHVSPDYYICKTDGCPCVGSPTEMVESKVREGIKIWFNNFMLEYKNTDNKIFVGNEKIIQQIDTKIEKLNNQLTNTYDLLEQGLYTKELFLQRQETLSNDIDNLKKQKEKLIEDDRQKKAEYDLKQNVIPNAQKLIDNYDALTAREKNEILKNLFHKIIYSKNEKAGKDKSKIGNFQLEFVSKFEIEHTDCNSEHN